MTEILETPLYSILLLYILDAAYFVFISKKVLFEKMPIYKGILMLLLSPPAANGLATLVELFTVSDESSPMIYMWYSLLHTLVTVLLQLLFLVCYVKLTEKEKRPAAMFLYLCNVVMLPGIIIMNLMSFPVIPCLLTIAMGVLFYRLAVPPLAKSVREKHIADRRLLALLPISAYLYKMLTLFLLMYREGLLSELLSNMIQFIGTLDEAGDAVKENTKTLLMESQAIMVMLPVILYVSDLFVMFLLTIAFYIITRNIRYMNEARKAHDEVKTLAVEMMEALAHTIDAKDKYTIGHSVRVAKYSRMIAAKMGLSDKECENVYYYGLLHDLGKIGVPNAIINSPTKLTDEEYNVIKRHPGIGYDILSEIHSRPDLTIGARWHHERYDGKGYPDGKKGEEIPLLARIIAVADSYDAMTSNRSYRSYLPQETVKAELEKNKGTQFDPKIADYMIAIMEEDTEYSLHE